MKRLVLSLWVAALLAVYSFPALAQTPDEFEKELEAFRKKSPVQENAAPTPATAKTGVTENSESPDGASSQWLNDLEGSIQKSTQNKTAVKSKASPLRAMSAEDNNAGQSPLGPAAELPVNGQMPATSYAMDMRPPEEIQAEMEAYIEEQKRKNNQASYNQALKELMPLRPEQVRQMLDAFKASREAAETPITVPTPKVQVETVSLDPSQAPSSIKTAPGRVTTITIVDETGSPWPIQDVSWAGKFDLTPPEEGGHVIRVTPQSAHGVGNVSIRLVDLITPITFTLQTGIDEVYYRFDARIPKAGPLAKTPLIEYGGLKAVAGTDENLVQILDGTPPGSSEKLKVEGADGRTSVWRLAGRIYLRTPLTLLSPAWNSSVTSADGMNVYTLNDTPVILLSDQGRMVQAHIAADEVAHDAR